MAFFVTLIGAAIVLDIYFEKNPIEFNQMESKSDQTSVEHGTIYLFAQGNSLNAKTSFQKTFDRKLFQKSHDKLFQKYHQLRNYQIIKADSQIRIAPLTLAFHYLVFRNCSYTVPDDEPLIS